MLTKNTKTTLVNILNKVVKYKDKPIKTSNIIKTDVKKSSIKCINLPV